MERDGTWSMQVICLLSLMMGTGFHTAEAAEPPVSGTPTPPQYLTAPIHAPELQQDLINGRLTFAAGKSGKPPVGGSGGGGSTSVSSAFFSLQQQGVVVNSTDAVNRLDSYQGETAIVSLGDGSRWVGGYNSIYPGQCDATLANCAPGASFITTSTTPPSVSQSLLPLLGNLVGFDPSVAVDGAGTVYYSYGVCSGSCSSANVLVATTQPGQTNELVWSAHVVTPPASNIFDDKYVIAADTMATGKAYIAWTRNKGNNQMIVVSGTNDSGVTWSSPVKVNDGTSKFERVLYAVPTVSPVDGSIYVAWMDYAQKAIYVDKSPDGVNWGTDVKAASLSATFTDLGCNGGRSMAANPVIAVDSQGYIYVTFADIKGSTGMDVYLVYSKNGGSTWSSPYRLNDDQTATHQYNPAMGVLGNGNVHVSWLDRRDDSNNNCATKAYATYSSGAIDQSGTPTFSINLPLIDTASDFDGNPNGPGDYTGIAVFSSMAGDTALSFYPTHLPSDISAETNTAGGFEAYSTLVSP